MAEGSKKMKLEVEFDRDEVAATMMLMGGKLTEERWEELTKAPITMDFSKFGKDSTEIAFTVVGIGITSAGIII